MTKDTAGLSLQEAFAAAEAEEGLSEPASVEPDSTPAEPSEVSQLEQPNVESQEEEGLFKNLPGDKSNEQPPKDSMHQVKVRGETIEVSYDELIAGYSRQEDYTRDKQEVANLRQEAEDALALKAALENNPRSTIQALWDAANKGQSPMAQVAPQAPASQSEDVDINSLVEQKIQEMLGSDPRIQEIESQRALDEVNLTFAQIEKDWDIPPLTLEDKEYVLNKAVEWQSNDIEAVFAKLMHLRDKENKERENAQANSTATGYGGGAAVAPAPTQSKRYTSFREAMNETFAEEGIDEAALGRAISNL